MKYKIQNETLQKVIDELGEEYKDLLLFSVANSSKVIDFENISIPELIRQDIDTKLVLRKSIKKRKFDKMNNIFLAVSLFYIAIGLVMMFWSGMQERIVLSPKLDMSLVIMITGLAFAVLALSAKQISRLNLIRSDIYNMYPYLLVNKWKEVEGCISELESVGNTTKSKAVTLEILKKDKVLSESETKNLRKLLILRNKIIHTNIDELNLSKDDVKKIIEEADKTLKRLTKMRYA